MTAPLLALPYRLPLRQPVGSSRGAAQHAVLQGQWLGRRQADGEWLFADAPVLPGRPHLQPLLDAFALDVLQAREAARAAGLPLDVFLAQSAGDGPAQTPLPSLDLQVTCDPPVLLNPHQTRRWQRDGYRAVKVKVGVDDGPVSLRALAAAAQAAGLQLRLDANGTWGALPESALLERLALCAQLAMQWVEDPTPLAQWPQTSPVWLAHDLIDSTPADALALVQSGRAQALVLKPALCGSLAAARQLALAAHAAGAVVVASSCFDSPLGLALLAAVAASWGIPLAACGLATHLGLINGDRHGPLAGQRGRWLLRALWPTAHAWPVPPPAFASESAARSVGPYVVDLTGPEPQTWSRSAWQRTVHHEARQLLARAPGPDWVVAGQHETSAPAVCRALACLQAGLPWLPIHPRWTASERDAVLARVPNATLVPLDLDAPPARGFTPQQQASVALWLATSGTTGRPKLVGLDWPALVWSARATLDALQLPSGTGFLLCLPVCHIAGLQVVLRALACDGRLVLASATDPTAQLQAIVRYRLGAVSLVPTQLARWLEADAGLLQAAAATLRVVLVGAAGAPLSLLQQGLEAGLPIRTTYAMTETAGTLAIGTPAQPPLPGVVCGGLPLPGVEVVVANPDSDGVGDVAVRSPGLLRGYLDTPLPGHADGWWATGDRGLLDAQGCLWLAARQSERIVRGGENIDPLEVEQALPPLPGVVEWAVVAQPDELLGAVPLLVVVVERDVTDWPPPPALLRPDALPKRWQDALLSLAPFKRPAAVLVQLQPLPRTALGKLQRVLAGQQAAQLLSLATPI